MRVIGEEREGTGNVDCTRSEDSGAKIDEEERSGFSVVEKGAEIERWKSEARLLKFLRASTRTSARAFSK